jgi:hypothetical protein
MSLWGILNHSLSKSLEFFTWTSYTKIMWLHNFLDFSSHFMIFSHLFLNNSISNYSNNKTWSENFIDSHTNIFWLHNHPIKVSNGFDKVILYIFHNYEHLTHLHLNIHRYFYMKLFIVQIIGVFFEKL